MGELLNLISSPDDVKKLTFNQLEMLAEEIRSFLIEKVSKTGGHIASNLGAVELTLALHKVFDSPKDKIIWDVGHQSYVHKIITGRMKDFDTLRQLGGISGFPKSEESCHDSFNTGHSSTSISAALGMVRARDIKKEDYSVIAIIGDGALTGGMAFEAMNDAGRSSNNLIVVLNDNEMSIARNVGGMSRYLTRLRTQPFYFKAKEDLESILNKIPAIGKSTAKALQRAKGTIKYMLVPGVIFEELGFKYLGPIDGHNIRELTRVFSRAKATKGPVFIHICTKKGKGYKPAEENPHKFHGISPFDIETGEAIKHKEPSYSEIFGKEMLRQAERDPSLVAITAAMPQGTGLEPFSRAYPDRFFDVGIAEQHAVTFAAGLAKGGMKPVVAIYSSFMQRAYDQILHDVALQNLHVIFAIDRAGIVGEDGETHQGLYDLSFLGHIPNMTIMAPCDYQEFAMMLDFAIWHANGPIAIRYPKGVGQQKLAEAPQIKPGQGFVVREGRDVTLVAIGNMVETALNLADKLKNAGVLAEVINARFAKPLDSELIIESAVKTGRLFTLEDNTAIGGFGCSVLEMLSRKGVNVKARVYGFPDTPVIHGRRSQLFEKYGMDEKTILSDIMKTLT